MKSKMKGKKKGKIKAKKERQNKRQKKSQAIVFKKIFSSWLAAERLGETPGAERPVFLASY